MVSVFWNKFTVLSFRQVMTIILVTPQSATKVFDVPMESEACSGQESHNSWYIPWTCCAESQQSGVYVWEHGMDSRGGMTVSPMYYIVYYFIYFNFQLFSNFNQRLTSEVRPYSDSTGYVIDHLN